MSPHPVQDVTHHRPPGWFPDCMLAQNPVIVDLLEGSVFLLQLHPGVEVLDQVVVARRRDRPTAPQSPSGRAWRRCNWGRTGCEF